MEQMKHFSYAQELTYHELYEGDDHPVYCHACCEAIFGPAYIHDNISNPSGFDNLLFNVLPLYGLHKSCAELPREIQHPLHPHHPLTASFRRGHINVEFRGQLTDTVNGFICEGCRRYSWGFSYNCDGCPFKLDVRCASKLESQQLQMEDRMERDTDFHNHKLEMFYYDMLLPTPFFKDIVCCYCLEGFHHSAYACIKCRLFIHESCLGKIPQQVPSPFHLQHPLLLRQPSTYKRCGACREYIDGLMLSCQLCSDQKYNFHISCCAHTSPSFKLKYDNEHPMFYIKQGNGFGYSSKCVVCNTSCDHCSIYRCVECDISAHIECIPLPRVVKHECDPDHFLTLSDSLLLKIPSKEYRCDICEKEADLRQHIYYCEDCLYIAHVECVLSEEDPPLEILEYLVPRSRDESENKTKDESEQCGNESEQESFGAEEESFAGLDKIIASINEEMNKLVDKETEDELEQCSNKSEQEWKNNLKDCSLAEIDKIIASIKKEMDKLASKLEVVQAVCAQKFYV